MHKRALIGAHCSIAGGVANALLEGHSLGATTIQIFTANQRQWSAKALSKETLHFWEKRVAETGISQVMSHASYLINLGSNKLELLEKSRTTFSEEIARCQALKLAYLNFHPGAATGDPEERCLERIVESLLSVEKHLQGGELRLLLETTAGQGSTVGERFDQLHFIIERVKDKIPIGVCIDTCHIFAAGYDIRTEAEWKETLADFDKTIGLRHLYAFHVNDSVYDLGMRKDRHANLGKGKIGLDAFSFLMTHPPIASLPKYLETPDGTALWKEEIALLRSFA